MKKIVKLSIIFLLIWIALLGNVYAVTCNTDLQLANDNVTKGEEFIVYFKVSNIVSDRGIISLTATLEYDKNNLTLVKMEGKNGWETPIEGISYAPGSGKIAINRSGLGKNDETILELIFKAKEDSKTSAKVALKDITIADGDTPAKFDIIEKIITIKNDNTQTPSEPPTDNTIGDNNIIEDDNIIDDDNQNNNTTTKPDKNDNTIDNETTTNPSTNEIENTNIVDGTLQDNTITNDNKLPQTGDNSNMIIIVMIVTISMIAIGLYVKIRF